MKYIIRKNSNGFPLNFRIINSLRFITVGLSLQLYFERMGKQCPVSCKVYYTETEMRFFHSLTTSFQTGPGHLKVISSFDWIQPTAEEIKQNCKFPVLSRSTQLLHGLAIAVTRSNPDVVAPICDAMRTLQVSVVETEKWCPLAITAAERGDERVLSALLQKLENRQLKGSFFF